MQAGAKAVAILGRREKYLTDAKADIQKAGSSKVLTYPADILDEKALNEAFASIEKEAGKIDIVVANAGYLSDMGPVTTADVNEWWKGFEINIKGTLLTFRAFAAHKSANSPTFISTNTGVWH